MEAPLAFYRNGNYVTTLFPDGTKIRENNLDVLAPEFPESIDFCISNKCSYNCGFCYNNSTADGRLGDILSLPFLDTLRPGTEIALGGGACTEHPDFLSLLFKLRERGIIASATFNQREFEKNVATIRSWDDNGLLHGIGISYKEYSEDFISTIQQFPNAVLHLIAGVHTSEDLFQLSDKGLKVLILGYKHKGRGKEFYTSKIFWDIREFSRVLPRFLRNERFKVISFDNLALEQLDVKSMVPPDMWDALYMGDDGMFSMYVDGVNRTYARNSMTDVVFPLGDDIVEMFGSLKERSL